LIEDKTNEPAEKKGQGILVRDQIRLLVQEQPFAVLCMQGKGQPYGSIVSYAISEDLSSVIFCTSANTRKYRLLCANDRVALVIDSRPQQPDQIMEAAALTATGQAVEIPRGPARDRLATLLASRHPKIASFITDPSTALFQIKVNQYVYVTRFQEVHTWSL
jgi:nitroimidazol reductase NimA-like FMN-containing flavoprotein (pyridoxamine 5'-phosphate oxidase superfamily)